MFRNSNVARRLFMAAAMTLVVAGIASGNPPEPWVIDGGFGWGLEQPNP